MNSTDHDGRIDSPFIESAESAGVLDLTDTNTISVGDILPAPVTARSALEVSGVMPTVLPNRHRLDMWTGAGVTAVVGLVGVALFLTVWGWML